MYGCKHIVWSFTETPRAAQDYLFCSFVSCFIQNPDLSRNLLGHWKRWSLDYNVWWVYSR